MVLADLECQCGAERALNVWYLTAAKLHLHASYLLDDATTDGYKARIITLYLTAQRLIELSIDKATEKTGFCHYCPFFCYQVFTCAAFVVLKILMNGYFRSIIDVSAGTKNLEAAIAALRKISVVNNDLPARLGDVISFFCALPDTTVVGGVTIDDLRLRQVKNRMSMRIVYDCLWTWRRYFQEENEKDVGDAPFAAEDKSLIALKLLTSMLTYLNTDNCHSRRCTKIFQL
ncbi:hypothetical protein MRS44_003974 [Fusarium solani]|uniref:uncharacterized protein n=1 Tax=Fusarium solani TaxID=169388 RepID=UPI0032C479BE|nr:hypothetical protein MRS44_003974 [Fusarium solani]